jgi:predicted DNA-binding protein with PD1-like motif
MRTKLLHDGEQRTFAVVFDKGEEVMAGLTDFAKRERLSASHFTAIGAFSDVVLGYFDRDRREYRRLPLREQVEALTLTGDVALENGEPRVHAHVVVGRSDGTTRGGHLLEAHVWPTLEVVVVASPAYLVRRPDRETGLTLIAPDARAAAA